MKGMSAGAVFGLLLLAAVMVLGAMLDWYDGRETPAPCTSQDWSAYAPACNRWSPEPSRPVVIRPQKTGK